MKLFIIPLLLLLIQQETRTSERDQIVPVSVEYNASLADFVDTTQPNLQTNGQEEGSQGQGLVPDLSTEQPNASQITPKLIRRNAD